MSDRVKEILEFVLVTWHLVSHSHCETLKQDNPLYYLP